MSNAQNTQGAVGRRLEHVEEFKDEEKFGDWTNKSLSLTYFNADNKRVIQPRRQSQAPLPYRTMAINRSQTGGLNDFQFLSQRNLQLDNFDSVTEIKFSEEYSAIMLQFDARQYSGSGNSLNADIRVTPLDVDGQGSDFVILQKGEASRHDVITVTTGTGKPIKTMTITVAAAEDAIASLAAFAIYKVTMSK
jgi:hypothetical protein